MCGIYGWNVDERATKSDHQRLGVAAGILAHANDRRGGDSWGVYQDGAITRRLGRLAIEGAKTVRSMRGAKCLMAHTRNATTGSVIKTNSHPFQIGPIVGAHNGIVWNHGRLNQRHNRWCAVDSEHIFHHLAEELDLGEIEAYGGPVQYVDSRKNGVMLSRFNGGELAISCLAYGIAWSSCATDLEAALSIAGIDHQPYRVDEGTLYQATDQLYLNGDFPIGNTTFKKDWWKDPMVQKTRGRDVFTPWEQHSSEWDEKDDGELLVEFEEEPIEIDPWDES